MQIYLGAPLFTPYQRGVLDQLTNVMIASGFDVFSPLEESKAIWKGRAPMQCSVEERRQVVAMNYAGIDSSDLMFAWVGGWNPAQSVIDYLDKSGEVRLSTGEPAYLGADTEDEIRRISPSLPDTGVAVEIGYAFKAGKSILGYLHDDEHERHFNLMLSDGTMDGVARGLNELRTQLVDFKKSGVFGDMAVVESEPEEMPV